MSHAERARAVPYLVLGETRRHALAEHVRARVVAWHRRWIPEQPANVRVEVLEAPEPVRDARIHDAACFRVSAARPGVVMLVPARCLPQVVGILGDVGEGGGGAGQSHGLVGQLELEALCALARELRTPDALEPSVERMTGTVEQIQREYGALRYASALVTLGECKCPVVLLMSPELMSAAIPSRAAAAIAERFERRSAAVAQEVVGVEAVLGDGEVSVSELARLVVGDVIVLEKKLGEPASLAIRGGGRIVGAAPGRVDAMRAVQIRRGST